MKRIATLAVILLLGLSASASSIRYFTLSQATRTVRYLNAQNEMMIYCGYDYEIETYVLINEIWMERVNSAYYEVWVYGYDAYTGDEIYMPLDLNCVWLFSAGRIYNAAQYLRFHSTARTPNITWYVPAYNPYTRVIHRPGYVRSYHYDIHRHGWMPPTYTPGPGMPPPPLPPYYMREPGAPAPRPNNTWTPGVDRPHVTAPSTNGRTGSAGRVITGGSNTGSNTGNTGSSGTRTGNNVSGGSSRGNNAGTTTGTGSSRGNNTGTTTGTGSSRGNNTGTTTTGSSRGNNTGTTTTTSGRGTTTGTTTTTSGRGTTTGTTPTRTNTSSASSSSRSSNSSASSTNTPSTRPTATNNNNNSGTTTSSRTNTGSSRSAAATDKTKSNTRGTTAGTTTSTRGKTTSTRGTGGTR